MTTIRLQAMSLGMPLGPHPNRHDFSGVLTRVDEPSDRAPGGSGGKRVIITRAAAERALGSLVGMGINAARDGRMAGHDATHKIGVISTANLVGNEIHISGHLYAADFPAEVASIRAGQGQLGFSYECQDIQVENQFSDPMVITACTFTGASILLRTAAAYTTTSLAAAADTVVTRPVTIFDIPLHQRW